MKFIVYRIVLRDQNAEDVAVSLNDDLVEYTWTDLADLGRLKLTPPSVELFKRIGYLPIQFGSPDGDYPSRLSAYAVVVDEGNVLCLEVRGRYHLPGGGIDAGEDPKEAIVREIFEETGYRAIVGEEIGRANQFFPTTREGTPLNKVATFYRASVDRSSGGVGQETDHAVRWVPVDDFLSSMAADFQKWAVQETLDSSRGN